MKRRYCARCGRAMRLRWIALQDEYDRNTGRPVRLWVLVCPQAIHRDRGKVGSVAEDRTHHRPIQLWPWQKSRARRRLESIP